MKKIRLGIISDRRQIAAWQTLALQLVQDTGLCEFAFLHYALPEKKQELPLAYRLSKGRSSQISLHRPVAMERQDIPSHLQNVAEMSLAEAQKEQVDIIIDLSATVTSPGKFPNVRYGIWSYYFGHTSDPELAGYEEMLRGQSLIESGIKVSLPGKNDQIIYRSFGLNDPGNRKQSMNQCFWKSASFAARVLKELASDPEGFDSMMRGNAPAANPPFSTFAFSSLYLWQIFQRALRRVKRGSTRRDWILMYSKDKDAGKQISIPDFTRLQPPAGHFWADPILTRKDGRSFCFIEDYVYKEGKGRISVLEENEHGKPEKITPVLDRPYHLSYPFVFEWKGVYYMIPETSDNKTIELYECTEFPYKWELKKILMENVRAVDSTLYFHEGKFWLFTNMEENEGSSLLDELFVFYCEDIINSELIPHPQNPVITDVRRARPAGPLYVHEGNIYRPSQICSPYYGYGLSINQITILNETEYSEKTVTEEPADRGELHGAHTLTHSEGYCFIDALADVKK